MPQMDPQQSDPSRLAQLFELEDTPHRAWSQEELGAMLSHQLAAPLLLDLERVAPFGPAVPQGSVRPSLTFGELLSQSQPSLELLKKTKQFAKASRVRGESALPPEIATLLYFGSIVVARHRLGERISEQSDEALVYGVQWVIDQPWVDEATRGLFRSALTQLNPHAQR
jgi:hypothetical protein